MAHPVRRCPGPPTRGRPRAARHSRQATRRCLQTDGTSTRRVRCASAYTAFPMHGLNPQQSAAVAHVEGPLLVLAGAGSGKTRVIVEKIAHLIGTGRHPARRIAAITFTNKSRSEEHTSELPSLMRNSY